MRAIVIGHRGLIGSAVASHLRSIGQEVVGVDRANYVQLVGASADLLVNAGGSPDKRMAIERPRDAFTSNVDDVMRALADFPARHYVHISSASVYPHPDDLALNGEDSLIDPVLLSPYGVLKYMGELLARTFASSWTILRIGPVVGPELRRNAIFDLLQRGSLFVSPDSALCYVDSRTVARAVWELRDPPGEIYNVAGQGTARLSDIARDLRVQLDGALWDLPVDRMHLDVTKALRRMDLPMTEDVVRGFAAEWRRTQGSSVRS